MVRWGRIVTCVKRTKNFEAFGELISKELEEGLSSKGRKRVSMMIHAPFGESGVLILWHEAAEF